MKIIKIDKWERKSHLDFFKGFESPTFNISINSNVKNLYNYAKKHNISFFLITLYVILKASNNTTEFKQRIINNQIVEYENISCVTPIMTKNNLYNSLNLDYFEDFESFLNNALPLVEKAKNAVPMEEDYKNLKQDRIVASCIPWFSFTSINSAVLSFKSTGVPVIAWGKFFEESNKLLMPISLGQLNHIFIDGIHVARFIELLEEYINNPENL